MDRQWWEVHSAEVAQSFRGERLTVHSLPGRHGTEKVMHDGKPLNPHGNSGAGAIELARISGARRILLLGYDCQHTGGKKHWHGDHPAGTAGNAAPKTVAKWPAQFRKVAATLAGIEVINCSRETALTVFPRAELERVLCP